MGDNYLAGQRDHRRRGRERATTALGRPTLFTRPDIVNTTYTVAPAENVEFERGERLTAYTSSVGGRVNFVRGVCIAGHSEGDSAAALGQAMSETGDEGFAVEVLEVSGLSGYAKVRITEGVAGGQQNRASA